MRFQIRQLTFLLILSALTNFVNVHATDIHSNDWDITLNPNHSFTFNYKGKTLLKNAYARAISSDNDELLSLDYPAITQRLEAISDAFGTGTKYIYTFSGRQGKPDMEQIFYLYNNHNY